MYEKFIKQARIDSKKTQLQVSKETGIPQPTISWIEKGQGIANIQQCKLLADCYGITIDELIGREPPKATPLISYTHSTHNGNNYIK